MRPSVKVDFLTYSRLIGSIPQLWKEKTSNGSFHKLTEEERNETFSFKIKDKYIKITDARCFHFYQSWISNNVPTAVINWEDKGYLMKWDKVFKLPYLCTTSTRLQSLHIIELSTVIYRLISTYSHEK